MNKLSTLLIILLDAGEWLLHITTMIGAVVLVVYSVYKTMIDADLTVFIPVIVAGLLLAINIAMRTRPAIQKGGGSKV